MSMHCGHVTVLTNVRKHPNADSLLLGTCLRNTVCVSLDYTEGQVGVYLINGRVYGIWASLEYPMAWAIPESGTPAT